MTKKRFYYVKPNSKCTVERIYDSVKGTTEIYAPHQLIKLLNTQHKEIQKLKAQLYCTADGVCDICNNEYLVLQGKYYISKCKKGHEECSKMDLDYCDDFELKDDGDV